MLSVDGTHRLHMDRLKKVTGTWEGTYRYAPVAHIPKLDPVPFTLILKQGWFGRFTGTVTDGGPRAMPGTGLIRGYFSFPRIEFTKQMPVCYVVTPDGRNIPLREFLVEQGHMCERDVPHKPIFYEGEFSSPSQAHGTWIIRAGPVPLGDGRTVQMTEARGDWSIESRATSERCSEPPTSSAIDGYGAFEHQNCESSSRPSGR